MAFNEFVPEAQRPCHAGLEVSIVMLKITALDLPIWKYQSGIEETFS